MKIQKSIAVATLLATSGIMAADATLTLEGVSDYRFRGISQTAGDPTVQASFDIAFENGFYVGTFASSVDFADDADVEVDYYGGYYWEINDTVGLDVSLSYYTYPGYDIDSDYLEIVNSLYVGDFVIQYAYSDDFLKTDEPGHYVAVDYSYPLAEKAGDLENVALNVHAGYNFGDYWEDIDIGEFPDYSIGVSASWGAVDLSLAYLYNSVDKDMEVDSDAFRNDDIILLSIGTTFDLFSF